jgi:hypothetical protein
MMLDRYSNMFTQSIFDNAWLSDVMVSENRFKIDALVSFGLLSHHEGDINKFSMCARMMLLIIIFCSALVRERICLGMQA